MSTYERLHTNIKSHSVHAAGLTTGNRFKISSLNSIVARAHKSEILSSLPVVTRHQSQPAKAGTNTQTSTPGISEGYPSRLIRTQSMRLAAAAEALKASETGTAVNHNVSRESSVSRDRYEGRELEGTHRPQQSPPVPPPRIPTGSSTVIFSTGFCRTG